MAEQYILQYDEITITDITDHDINPLSIRIAQPQTLFYYERATNTIMPSEIELRQLVTYSGIDLTNDVALAWYCNGALMDLSDETFYLPQILLVDNEVVVEAEATYKNITQRSAIQIRLVEKETMFKQQVLPEVSYLDKDGVVLLNLRVTSGDDDVTWMAKDIKWYRNGEHVPEYDDEFIIPVQYQHANSIFRVDFQINNIPYSAQATVFGTKTLLLVTIDSTDGTVFVDRPINTILKARVYTSDGDITDIQNIQWYKDNTPIQGATSQNLQISNLAESQVYTCKASYNNLNGEQSIQLLCSFTTKNLVIESSTQQVVYTQSEQFVPTSITLTPKLFAGHTVIDSPLVYIYDENNNLLAVTNSGQSVQLESSTVFNPNDIPTFTQSKILKFVVTHEDVTYTSYYSIKVTNEKYQWLKEWNNQTLIGSNYIQTGKLFAGYEDQLQRLTGVLIGNFSNVQVGNNQLSSGITQLQQNRKVFEVVSHNPENVKFFVGTDLSYITFDSTTGLVEVQGIIRTIGGASAEDINAEENRIKREVAILYPTQVLRKLLAFTFTGENSTYSFTLNNETNENILAGLVLVFASEIVSASITCRHNGQSVPSENVIKYVYTAKVLDLTLVPGENTIEISCAANKTLTTIYQFAEKHLSAIGDSDDPSVPGVYISSEQLKISDGTRWVAKLTQNGDGFLASRNIYWNTQGDLTLTGNVNITGGSMRNIVQLQGQLVVESETHTMKIGQNVDGLGNNGIYINENNYILPSVGFSFGTNDNNRITVNGNILEIKSDYLQVSQAQTSGIRIRNGKLAFEQQEQQQFLQMDSSSELNVKLSDVIASLPVKPITHKIGTQLSGEDVVQFYEQSFPEQVQTWTAGVSRTITKKPTQPQLFVKLKFIVNLDSNRTWTELMFCDPDVTQLTITTTQFVSSEYGVFVHGRITDQTARELYNGILWFIDANTMRLDVRQTHYQVITQTASERTYDLRFLSGQTKDTFVISDQTNQSLFKIDRSGDVMVQKNIYSWHAPLYLPKQQRAYFNDDIVDLINGIQPLGYSYESYNPTEFVR